MPLQHRPLVLYRRQFFRLMPYLPLSFAYHYQLVFAKHLTAVSLVLIALDGLVRTLAAPSRRLEAVVRLHLGRLDQNRLIHYLVVLVLLAVLGHGERQIEPQLGPS